MILGAEPKNQVIRTIRCKFMATLYSKTIDFDQPFENALFNNGKMQFSPRKLGERFQYHTHLNPLIKPISERYDTHWGS